MDDRERLIQQMAVAHSMQQNYDPSTLDDLLARMEKAAKFPALIASKIRNEGVTQESVRLMHSYAQSMAEYYQELGLHYALTGQAGHDMMQQVTEQMRSSREDRQRGD